SARACVALEPGAASLDAMREERHGAAPAPYLAGGARWRSRALRARQRRGGPPEREAVTILLPPRPARFARLHLLARFATLAAIGAMPGDPVALRFGKSVDPERVALERGRLGLDEPGAIRFAASQARFWSGDWGASLSGGRPVVEDARAYLPATIE